MRIWFQPQTTVCLPYFDLAQAQNLWILERSKFYFSLGKGPGANPQCPRKLVDCSVKPKTQAPEIQLTASGVSLCAAAWGRPPAGSEAASSTAVVVIISVINKQALMRPSGERGRLSLLRRQIPGMSHEAAENRGLMACSSSPPRSSGKGPLE